MSKIRNGVMIPKLIAETANSAEDQANGLGHRSEIFFAPKGASSGGRARGPSSASTLARSPH
jgi:hypothetical protein